MRYCILFLLLSSMAFGQDLESIGQEKPFQLHSGLNLRLQAYQSDRPDPIQPGFAWYLSGSPVVEVYGLKMPFSFLLSNQQRSIQQPFNQFGLSPSYRWATLHLGFFNPQYSPFTLAGRRMLGVGTELNPGKFRFAASYGRFRKPIQFENNPTTATTFLLPGAEPSYRQEGYAFKIGIGSPKNFVDLIYLKGKMYPKQICFP